MRMGVRKKNLSRFLFHVLNYRCRGTLRARIQNCKRFDKEASKALLGGLVYVFMLCLRHEELRCMKKTMAPF